MTAPHWTLRRLHSLDDSQSDQLADVLIDCVEGGASVSFMHPLSRDRARGFWQRVALAAACGVAPTSATELGARCWVDDASVF